MKAIHSLVMLIVLVVAGSLLTFPAYSAELTMGEAINKAGRQRMLSQRIIKAYAMMGQDVGYRKAKKQLRKSIALFDSQLAELKALSVNGDITDALSLVEVQWAVVKEIVSKKSKRIHVAHLRTKGEALLNSAHQVVVLLERAANNKAGHEVNVAGRQRMLTQRMASLYMLQSWNFTDDLYKANYEQAVKEFDKALKELQGSAQNSAEIKANLVKVEQLWKVFKLSGAMKSGKFVPTLVTRSLDKILIKMNEVTGQYAALLK
jgi:nitrate/nitrite-specific signal transduction histidine kinase